MHTKRSIRKKKKKEESGWGDVGSEMGSLMSGRWQIPKFLSCAYRTKVTPGEQCGFMLMLQLKGPALIRMLAENNNCPLKEWAWGPHLKSYFAMPHRNKAGPVYRVFFLSHCTKAPQTHPCEDSQTMWLKAENKHLTPVLTYFEPLF